MRSIRQQDSSSNAHRRLPQGSLAVGSAWSCISLAPTGKQPALPLSSALTSPQAQSLAPHLLRLQKALLPKVPGESCQEGCQGKWPLNCRRAERGCPLPLTRPAPLAHHQTRPHPPSQRPICWKLCDKVPSCLCPTVHPTFPFMSYPGLHALSTALLNMPLPMHPITPLLWRGSGAGPNSLARRCSCCSSAACCPEAAHYRPRRPRQRRPPASRARRGLRRRPRRPGAACPIAWPKKVAAIKRAAATAQRSLSADIHTACTCVPTPAQVRCLVRQQVVG